jgi:hypothetical protein
MNDSRRFALILICLLISGYSAFSQARPGWRSRGMGPRGPVGPTWRGGYWFHGAYVGRAGWWWVVGPTWYYYPAPPVSNAQPVYIVQVASAPPPFPTSGTVTVPSAPPPLNGSAPAPAAPASGDGKPRAFSYYCEKQKSYYPTLKDCPDGWLATPVAPPVN